MNVGTLMRSVRATHDEKRRSLPGDDIIRYPLVRKHLRGIARRAERTAGDTG